jgi:hypothetical protein
VTVRERFSTRIPKAFKRPIRTGDLVQDAQAAAPESLGRPDLRIVGYMVSAPMTGVETGEFWKRAEPLLLDSERAELVAFVGADPEAGEVVPLSALGPGTSTREKDTT